MMYKKVELKENENGSIDSNILAISNEDEILGKDIYVRDNTFESISNAIAGAESGDIIYLSGTYKNNWEKHIEINKDISNNKVNTICLFADKEYQFLSSTIVKEVLNLDKPIDKYVHPYVKMKMYEKKKGRW